jgi:hypothetical protein
MTKARARKRAKARAAANAGKPPAKGGKPEVKVRPGKFDAKTDATWHKGGGKDIKNPVGIRRGAARSR